MLASKDIYSWLSGYANFIVQTGKQNTTQSYYIMGPGKPTSQIIKKKKQVEKGKAFHLCYK